MIIKAKVYNRLTRALIKHRATEKELGMDHCLPFLFLLASKDGKVINGLLQLKENTGTGDRCYRMSNLSAKEIIRGSLKIMKKGYQVLGLVRVGNFHRGNFDNHHDGNVRSELRAMGKGVIFMSVDPTNIWAEKAGHNEKMVIIR